MKREDILEDILQNSGAFNKEEIDYLRDIIKSSEIYKAKSDQLFRFGLMNQLMFDSFGKFLDMMMVLRDPETNETISFTHSSETESMPEGFEKSEKTVDKLIRVLIHASGNSTRVNDQGQTCGNEILTILMNVVAWYYTLREDFKDGFNACVKYWEDKKTEKDSSDDEAEEEEEKDS